VHYRSMVFIEVKPFDLCVAVTGRLIKFCSVRIGSDSYGFVRFGSVSIRFEVCLFGGFGVWAFSYQRPT
jgi:hypothetical protein